MEANVEGDAVKRNSFAKEGLGRAPADRGLGERASFVYLSRGLTKGSLRADGFQLVERPAPDSYSRSATRSFASFGGQGSAPVSPRACPVARTMGSRSGDVFPGWGELRGFSADGLKWSFHYQSDGVAAAAMGCRQWRTGAAIWRMVAADDLHLRACRGDPSGDQYVVSLEPWLAGRTAPRHGRNGSGVS